MQRSSHCVLNVSEDYVYFKDELAVHIALFKNVKNTFQLVDKSIQENATFLDARLIFSKEQLLIAINRSLYLSHHGKCRLKSFFAEILFNLSIFKNISESLKEFGIEKLKDKDATNLIVITMDKYSSIPELFNKIDGELISLSNDNLLEISDLNMIRKVYKTDNLSLIETKIASKEYLN